MKTTKTSVGGGKTSPSKNLPRGFKDIQFHINVHGKHGDQDKTDILLKCFQCVLRLSFVERYLCR